jgi:hypothetical protein
VTADAAFDASISASAARSRKVFSQDARPIRPIIDRLLVKNALNSLRRLVQKLGRQLAPLKLLDLSHHVSPKAFAFGVARSNRLICPLSSFQGSAEAVLLY